MEMSPGLVDHSDEWKLAGKWLTPMPWDVPELSVAFL